jgi:hypothetical protein
MRRCLYVLLAVCCHLLTSCGSGERDTTAAPARPADSLGALLPPLSSLPDAARTASATEVLVIEGDLAVQTEGSATNVAPSALALQSGAAELAYALYSFSLPEQSETIAFFAVELLELSRSGNQYMAIANFERKRWEIITAPVLTAGAQTLSDTSTRNTIDYSSPGGNCFIAVLAYDSLQLTIDNVTLASGAALLPPGGLATNGIEFSQTFTDRIELSWQPAAGADAYDLYYRVLDLAEDDPFELLASIPGGSSSTFTHSESNPAAKPAAFAVFYEYKLKSRQGAEESLLFSNSALGQRTLWPPESVSASQEAHPEDILISWSSVPGASSYLVYRDTLEAAPLAEVATTTITDTPGDFALHDYFVRSRAVSGDSPLATQSSEAGSCIEWQMHPVLEIGPDVNRKDKFPSLALVGGLPAIAYFDSKVNELCYLRPTVDEPADDSNWQKTTVATSVEILYPLEVVEHNGKPWIAFHHLDEDQLFVARSSNSMPDANDDWTKYELADVQVNSDGVKMAEADGLLHVVFQYREAAGGATLLFRAFEPEPLSKLDWYVDFFDGDSVGARDFDIAGIAGGVAIAYEDDGLAYIWTDDEQPGPEDWTASRPPLPADFKEVRSISLGAAPAGFPVIQWTHTIDQEGNPDNHLRLSHSSLPVPLSIEDWSGARAFENPEGSSGIDFCHYLDRPLLGMIRLNNDVQLVSALSSTPADEAASWMRYTLYEAAPGQPLSGPLGLLSYNDRPVVVYVRNITAINDEHIMYCRAQPK